MRPIMFLVLCATSLVPSRALATEAARYRGDQTPGSSVSVEAGQSLFSETCSRCHGPSGGGKAGWAPRLNDQVFLAAASNDFIRNTLSEGRPGTNMVTFRKMFSRDQIDALVSLVRSWQASPGIALDDSPLGGDRETGRRVYLNTCASCHGAIGNGVGSAGATVAIGWKSYLEVAGDGYLRYTLGRRCKDTGALLRFIEIPEASRPARTPLTSYEIDSVIRHLRAGPP